MCMKLGLVKIKWGSLIRNDDDNDSYNVKKKIGFWSKTVSECLSRPLHDYDEKNLLIRRFIEDVNIQRRIFLSHFEPE